MTNLSDIKKITATIKADNKKNFQCDGYAFDLQNKLDDAGIPFQGKLLVFRRSHLEELEGINVEDALSSSSKSYRLAKHNINIPKDMRVYPKIILQDSDPQKNGQVVGNQTHFFTEIALDDGQVYCFDNNHPDGISKPEFYGSLEFKMEVFLPKKDPMPEPDSLLSQRDLSARTVFCDKEHNYKNHQEILSKNHLLMVDTSVQSFREKLKEEPNWQYHLKQKLDKNTHYEFLDEKKLKELSTPITKLNENHFKILKESLQTIKVENPQSHLKDEKEIIISSSQPDFKSQLKEMQKPNLESSDLNPSSLNLSAE